MKRKHKATRKIYDSNFEEKFHELWKEHSTYPIVFHHTVHIQTSDPQRPTRKWELDFSFPEEKVAIELQGYGTGHTTYTGMRRDYCKHNDLLLTDWIILYFMSADLKDEPTTTIETIVRILEKRNPRIRNHSITPRRDNPPGTNHLIEAARRLLNKRLN
jgi:very-short-patch-repair endonuclease